MGELGALSGVFTSCNKIVVPIGCPGGTVNAKLKEVFRGKVVNNLNNGKIGEVGTRDAEVLS